MDPCFQHLERWPAWAAADNSAQSKPRPEQLWREDPTMDEASAKVAEARDRAADDGDSGTVRSRRIALHDAMVELAEVSKPPPRCSCGQPSYLATV